MNIKQLRLFHEVLTTGKMSIAAERLNFSQPAASKMLGNLESKIGYKLFLRQNSQLVATPEALHLHEEVLTLLQSLKRLEDNFERAKNGQLGSLNIAGVLGPTYSLIPRIFDEYAKDQFQIKLNLQVNNSHMIRELISSGQFELGLVDTGPFTASYDSQRFELPCFCALYHGHPATNLKVVSPKDLDGEPWITLDPEHLTYHALKAAYLEENAVFNPQIEVNATLNGLMFVKQKRGVTLVDAINFQYYTEAFTQHDIVFRPFTPKITEPIELIQVNKRPLSKPAAEFRELIVKELERLCQL